MLSFMFVFLGFMPLTSPEIITELGVLQKTLKKVQVKITDLHTELDNFKKKMSQSKVIFRDISNGLFDQMIGSHRLFTSLPKTHLKLNPAGGTCTLNLVPGVGVYNTVAYTLMYRYLIIEMNAEILKETAPKPLVDKLVQHANAQVNFCIAIHGTRYLKAAFGDNNIVFHGFLVDCVPLVNGYSQRNLKMGVFGLDGVVPSTRQGSMPVDRLEARYVHCHDERISPNNAHVSIQDKKTGSFWSVVISPDEKRVAVTYNILINDKTFLDEKVLPIIKDSSTIDEIVNNLAGIDKNLDLRKFSKFK